MFMMGVFYDGYFLFMWMVCVDFDFVVVLLFVNLM